MSKQDRQGVRTPADLERKYDFNSLKTSSQVQKTQSKQIQEILKSVADLQNKVGEGGTSSLFLSFQVEDGNLYLYSNDETAANNFEYDEETGELYYVMEAE